MVKIQFQENILYGSWSASSVCLLSPGGGHKLEGETKPTLGVYKSRVFDSEIGFS